MANHKSALKRVGITAKKNLRNRMITSQVKTAVKSFDQSLASEDQAAINAAYINAVSTVDKAALHAKSRLTGNGWPVCLLVFSYQSNSHGPFLQNVHG